MYRACYSSANWPDLTPQTAAWLSSLEPGVLLCNLFGYHLRRWGSWLPRDFDKMPLPARGRGDGSKVTLLRLDRTILDSAKP